MSFMAPMLPTAPPAAKSAPLELEVEGSWHELLHQSKVATLALSPDGARLWTGCDAAAPRLQAHQGEPPLVAVSCRDGAILHRAASMPISNVRLVHPSPIDSRRLLCVTGDGLLLHLDGDVGTVLGSYALPGTPAEAAAAALGTPPACDGTVAADSQQENGSQEQGAAAALAGAASEAAAPIDACISAAAGPEFIAETGYRGPREGYLFRVGDKGSGYYRKDVVRRYCASAFAAPIPPPGSAANGESGAVSVGGATEQALSESRQYIQRLTRAPPNIHSAITDRAGHLLFTSSLGTSDTAIRVWRLHWSGSDGSSSGASSSGSSRPDEASTSCPQPELFRTLTGHCSTVLSLALSSDGSLLYSGSSDQSIRVWSTADWHLQRVLKGHGGGIKALVVAPDGGTLYSAAADNTIRAWSTQHWVCLRTMHGRHEDTCWPACLALSADGGLLASGSTGPFGASNIKVFQTGAGGGREPGTCLATFEQLEYEQKAGMTTLLFSPDGGTLYAGASNGSVAAWRLGWRAACTPTGIRRGFL